MELNQVKRIIGYTLSVFFLASTVVNPSAEAAACKTITSREWKLIAKNPNSAKGKNVWVFGKITQFDDATGLSVFRADVSGENKFDGKFFFGGENTMVFGKSSILSNFVTGDIFTACVKVLGSYSYTTALTKGTLVVPKIQAKSIKLIGTTD
ncbi:hypothetical protein MCEMZLE42_01089 [actinobacterium SCGC AAA044-D11]